VPKVDAFPRILPAKLRARMLDYRQVLTVASPAIEMLGPRQRWLTTWRGNRAV
jgi:hypothetical protein